MSDSLVAILEANPEARFRERNDVICDSFPDQLVVLGSCHAHVVEGAEPNSVAKSDVFFRDNEMI